jgi:hypothetical protein
MKDEVISAFAFNVGRQIEKICEERNGNLQKELEQLQASVLRFRKDLEESNNRNMLKLYDLYFNIEKSW